MWWFWKCALKKLIIFIVNVRVIFPIENLLVATIVMVSFTIHLEDNVPLSHKLTLSYAIGRLPNFLRVRNDIIDLNHKVLVQRVAYSWGLPSLFLLEDLWIRFSFLVVKYEGIILLYSKFRLFFNIWIIFMDKSYTF